MHLHHEQCAARACERQKVWHWALGTSFGWEEAHALAPTGSGVLIGIVSSEVGAVTDAWVEASGSVAGACSRAGERVGVVPARDERGGGGDASGRVHCAGLGWGDGGGGGTSLGSAAFAGAPKCSA